MMLQEASYICHGTANKPQLSRSYCSHSTSPRMAVKHGIYIKHGIHNNNADTMHRQCIHSVCHGGSMSRVVPAG